MIKILKWLPVQKNVHPQGIILARVHREWNSWFLEIALFASIYTPYIPVQIKSNSKKQRIILFVELIFSTFMTIMIHGFYILFYVCSKEYFIEKPEIPELCHCIYMTRLNPAIIFLNKDWCQTILNKTWYRMRFGVFLLHVSTKWCSAF